MSIVYLASYPKSGNTWIRLLLKTYLSNHNININNIDLGVMSTYKKLLHYDTPKSEYETLLHRHREYKNMSVAKDKKFLKVHDYFMYLEDNIPLFPIDKNKAIIIVRNPLEVACSYANHRGITIDEAITQMSDIKNRFGDNENKESQQTVSHMSSWSVNVQSWLKSDMFKIVVRYEDLHADTFNVFRDILTLLDIEIDNSLIRDTIDKCSFEELQKQEKQMGFKEKPSSSKVFFREGKIDSWRDILTDDQVYRIMHDHSHVMRILGYI